MVGIRGIVIDPLMSSDHSRRFSSPDGSSKLSEAMSASPELAGNGMRPAPVCRCGQVHIVENRDQPLAPSLRHDQALQSDSIRRVAPIRALCPCHLPGHIHRCHVRLEVFDADDGVMNRAVPERLLVVRRSPFRDVSLGTSLPHNIHVFRICRSEFLPFFQTRGGSNTPHTGRPPV